MPNIQNLQWWTDAVNVGVVIALALSFVFGGTSIWLSRKLNKAKDEQAARDKQASDEKIAAANEEAAKANREAVRIENEGKERVAKVEADANEKIAAGEKETKRVEAEAAVKIAEASKIAATANERAQELAKQNLATESRLESERAARLELVASIQPRELGEQMSLADNLRAFAGTKVIIECIADTEATRLASHLRFALDLAGWNVVGYSKSLDDSRFIDGIAIYTPTSRDLAVQNAQLEGAANTLTEQLNSRNLKVQHLPVTSPMSPRRPPEGMIAIRVGLKPDYYVEKERKRLEGEMERRRQQSMEEYLRDPEEFQRKLLRQIEEEERRRKEERRRRETPEPPRNP